MLVKELIAELQKLDAEKKVTLRIENPKDSAFTDEICVQVSDDAVDVVGWVASDNEGAFAPWAPED